MATIRNLIVRISVTEKTDKGIRRVTTSLRETNRELDAADKKSGRFSGTLSKLGKASGAGLAKLGQNALLAAKGIAAVAFAAGSLNTVVQLGSSLAPLAGLLAALPGVALGAAAAISTLHLATAGLGDAFKAAMGGDPKKFQQSLQGLSPAARSVALELHKLSPELRSIQLTAQQNLLAPLRGELTAMARVMVGPLRQGVANVALQFGLAGRQVTEFARQGLTVAIIRDAFDRVALSLHALLPAIQPVLRGLRNIADVGTYFLPGLAASVSQVATRFGQWMQQMAASGKAAEWIHNALATLRQLGQVVVNVGGILKSIFSAASAGGSQFLGVIGAALAQLNAFLKTAQGQQALTAIFQTLGAIGTSLGPVIGALVTQLGGLAAPLGRLAQMIGPILTTAINALGPALQQLEPGLTALFNGLGLAFVAIANSGALPALGKAISAIAIAIAPLLPVAGELAGILANNLANSVIILTSVLGPVIAAIAQSLAPILPQIAVSFAQLAQAMAPIATRFGLLLAQALVQILPPLLQIVPQLLQGLVPALIRMLIALTPLMPQLVDLGRVLAENLSKTLPELLPPLIQLIDLMAQWTPVMVPVLGWLVQISAALAGGLGDGLALALRAVSETLTGIFKWFSWLFDVLLGHSIIPDIVHGVIDWFGALPGRVVGLFTDMARGAANVTGGLLRYVVGIPGAIVSIFAGAGKWLVNAGKNIVVGLWNGIASLGDWLFNRVWAWVKAVLPGAVKWALGIASPSKVMAELGGFAGQGLAQGILGTAGLVERAAGTLAQAAVPPALPAGQVMATPAAGGAAAVSAPRGVRAAAGAGGGTVVLEVHSGGSRMDDLLIELIRKAVRVRGGGNVQIALGGS